MEKVYMALAIIKVSAILVGWLEKALKDKKISPDEAMDLLKRIGLDFES